MLTILKCPKCGAPALCPTSLTDASALCCANCGFTDYLKAYKNENKETAVSTPPLGPKFTQEIARVARDIQTLCAQGNIDGYIKQICLAYNLSPWTLIEAINAYLNPNAESTVTPNPLRFTTLVSGQARVDDLLNELRQALQAAQEQKASSSARPRATESSDAAEWIERYNKLQAEMAKKEKSYQSLLAEYHRQRQILEENGLE